MVSITLAAWLHNIDPYAIMLWEGGPIRWYGLSYLVGFLLGFLLIRRVCRVGISSLSAAKASDFVVAAAIGVVVGGRLGYCLFYKPELLVDFHEGFPYWGALELHKGGMASHGGIIGALLGCIYYAIRHGHSKLFLIDLAAFGTPLGLFFGRIANFINGELYGRSVDPNFVFAVKFPQEVYDWPLAQLERAWAAIDILSQQRRGYDGLISLIQNGNQQAIAVVEPMLTARHPSQLYAAALEGLVVFVVLAILWLKPRKPGTLTFAFMVTYGCMRMINELFRMPDAHLGFQALGLTRGQWLSVPLILIGITGLIWCTRRRADPVGGWVGKMKA